MHVMFDKHAHQTFLVPSGHLLMSGACTHAGRRLEMEPQLLLRVRQPVPTRVHPLQGLFRGVYGAHGIQVLAVEYTFAGPAAKICATKVGAPSRVAQDQHACNLPAVPLAELC